MFISNRSGSTLFTTLFSAYVLLLSKYCNQDDIIVGIPVAGRVNSEVEKIVGMFVNTLAIRINNINLKNQFSEFASLVKQNLLGAYENQAYPFEKLVEKLNIDRNIDRNPLFDTMFTLQNIDISRFNVGDIQFESFIYDTETSIFDFSLDAIETSEGINFILEYNTGLFKQ